MEIGNINSAVHQILSFCHRSGPAQKSLTWYPSPSQHIVTFSIWKTFGISKVEVYDM